MGRAAGVGDAAGRGILNDETGWEKQKAEQMRRRKVAEALAGASLKKSKTQRKWILEKKPRGQE